MLWVNTVPGVEDARFGHMQLDISSGPSVASDYTNLIYASDGAVSDTQTATLVGSDGSETALFNDNYEVFEGSSGDPASLVMNTIHDPTPDQGSGDDAAPIFGYEKCQWLRHASQELMGASCSAMYGGSLVSGTVFESAAGTMECGRLLAMNNMAMDAYETFSAGRCARGSPVDTANYAPSWTKRLLVGGECHHETPVSHANTPGSNANTPSPPPRLRRKHPLLQLKHALPIRTAFLSSSRDANHKTPCP